MQTELACLRTQLEEAVAAAYPNEEKVLVHGEGSINARVMLIGEAPGEQETRLRRPFVGKAGKNLDEFLRLAGIDRNVLYISNTVKFRPTRISAAGRVVNRPPMRGEIEFFLPWLKREIGIVSPQTVVTLGNVPLRALMGNRVVIGGVHGQFLRAEGFVVYPMYHPASVIYNPSLREVYTRDVLTLGQWLQTHPPGGNIL